MTRSTGGGVNLRRFNKGEGYRLEVLGLIALTAIGVPIRPT